LGQLLYSLCQPPKSLFEESVYAFVIQDKIIALYLPGFDVIGSGQEGIIRDGTGRVRSNHAKASPFDHARALDHSLADRNPRPHRMASTTGVRRHGGLRVRFYSVALADEAVPETPTTLTQSIPLPDGLTW